MGEERKGEKKEERGSGMETRRGEEKRKEQLHASLFSLPATSA